MTIAKTNKIKMEPITMSKSLVSVDWLAFAVVLPVNIWSNKPFWFLFSLEDKIKSENRMTAPTNSNN
jgi:hypothetical protein